MLIIDDFGPGGATLWAELHLDDDPVETTILVQEACRITDRLDRLAGAIKSDGIIDLIERKERGEEILEVRVDNALSEARHQANALRLLLNDIAKRRTVEPEQGEQDGLADL